MTQKGKSGLGIVPFAKEPLYTTYLHFYSVINSFTMEAIKATFAQCKKEGRSALVTYVTAGYPTAEETPDILLAMEAGGAGIPHDLRGLRAI